MRITLLVTLARRPRWLGGTLLMVAEWPLQVLALALAPITVVQPTLSTSLLALLAVARWRLGERVGRKELLGALAIIAGLAAVVAAAPRHSSADAAAGSLAAPLSVVGIGAICAYAIGRSRRGAGASLVIGAGLSYAWTDFVNKLLANDVSSATWGLAAIWLIAALLAGAAAFLQENTALQRRPAVTVAPVIAAVKEPLPVLMALWAGVEAWGSAPQQIAGLLGGLALVAIGATMLGRSQAVARIAAGSGADSVG